MLQKDSIHTLEDLVKETSKFPVWTPCADASYITTNILLANATAATDVNFLAKEKVTHVINLAANDLPTGPTFYDKNTITYKEYSICDDEDYDFTHDLLDVVAYMETIFNNQQTAVDDSTTKDNKITVKVLVHCMAGISRSATAVIAYLAKSNNIHLIDAINIVRVKRPIICPNKGFIAILWQLYNNK